MDAFPEEHLVEFVNNNITSIGGSVLPQSTTIEFFSTELQGSVVHCTALHYTALWNNIA